MKLTIAINNYINFSANNIKHEECLAEIKKLLKTVIADKQESDDSVTQCDDVKGRSRLHYIICECFYRYKHKMYDFHFDDDSMRKELLKTQIDEDSMRKELLKIQISDLFVILLDNCTEIHRKTLLTAYSYEQETALTRLLNLGIPELITLYCQYMADSLSVASRIELFTKPNNNGYTPLHAVLQSGSVEALQVYWQQLNKCLAQFTSGNRENILADLLMAVTCDHFNTLHKAAVLNDPDFLKRFIDMMVTDMEEIHAITILKKLADEATWPKSSRPLDNVNAIIESLRSGTYLDATLSQSEDTSPIRQFRL